jgi:hypothetical protein
MMTGPIETELRRLIEAEFRQVERPPLPVASANPRPVITPSRP